MPARLIITTDWERLDEGAPEERAGFGAIGVTWGDRWLTEGYDGFVNVLRKAPSLSGYHLAEWLAWNWWRQRWEPRSTRPDWAFAHRMSTIGHGYVWPDLTIFSDGERTALIARPTGGRPGTSYRYINDVAAMLPSADFEVAVDAFIETIRGKLRADGIATTNLDTLWDDVVAERRDPLLARRRRLEALLGAEPDDAGDGVLIGLIEEARGLGEAAVNELAAAHDDTGAILTIRELGEMAHANGYEASPRDGFYLRPGTGLPRAGDVAAWRRGAEAAQAVRQQAGLGLDPLSDERLSELAAIDRAVLDDRGVGSCMAYALDESAGSGRVVFRSKWKTGRRFELARLLGDRVVGGHDDRLFPATRSSTYRQKMQRSFSAELLSPFQAVDSLLNGDYSEEAQQELAERFDVSPKTIWTLLVNHGRIDRMEEGREDGAGDFDAGLAA